MSKNTYSSIFKSIPTKFSSKSVIAGMIVSISLIPKWCSVKHKGYGGFADKETDNSLSLLPLRPLMFCWKITKYFFREFRNKEISYMILVLTMF